MRLTVRAGVFLAPLLGWPSIGFAQQDPQPPVSWTIPGIPARPAAVPVPRRWQVFHDMEQGARIDLSRGYRHVSIRGETIAASLLERTSQATTNHPVREAARHLSEEGIVVLAGAVELTTEGQTRILTRLNAALIPAGIRHEILLAPGSRCLVYSMTPEPGFLGRVDSPTSSNDLPPRMDATEQVVLTDFNPLPWIGPPGQSRFRTTAGKSSTLTLWLTPAADLEGTDVPGHHHTIEQITCVLRGRIEARVGDRIQKISPGVCAMIPSDADHFPTRALDSEDLLLLDFQPLVRTDLLNRQRRQP